MENYDIIEEHYISQISDEEIDWRIENDDYIALEYDPLLKENTVSVDGRLIRNGSTARKGIIGILNKKCQKERQELFNLRVNSGADNGKIRIVSEGDSWFNYPTKLNEVIDNIFDDFSIFSIGYGGDWLSNIYQEQEYMKSIRRYRPEVFLISGGGNDMVGARRLEEILESYFPEAKAEELINQEKFNSIIEDFEILYRAMFKQLQTEFPSLKTVCHGYDYPFLDGKEKNWLGKPMKRKGIINLKIRNSIGKILIDRFNQMLKEVVIDFPNVNYLDIRDKVPRNLWKDELHPNENGFKIIAGLFRDKIFDL